MSRLEIPTPAKINLGLAVRGRRPDGYHEIETILQLVDLTDRLILEREETGQISLETDHPSLPNDEKNLVYQAARLLQRHTGSSWGVRMQLQKHIPIGAGLGGGSGNAAFALWGLNELWELGLTREELQELGRALGSDVPFFLFAAQAVGTGKGDALSPLPPLPPLPVLLINPGFSLSTALIYRRVRLVLTKRENRITMLRRFFLMGDVEAIGRHLFNDLETVVLEDHPVIGEMKEALLARGAEGAIMSGSGPTVLGLFAERQTAQDALLHLQQEHRGWWIHLTTTLPSLEDMWQRVRRDGT